jgi:hypothetical protein
MTPTAEDDPGGPSSSSAESTVSGSRHASGSAVVSARVATMSSGYGTEYAFRAGGWVEVRHSDAPRFLARFAPDEAGRLVPVALVLDPMRAIDSTMLQRLRLVSVEAYVNRPGVRERVLDYLSHPPNNPRQQDLLKALTFELPLISQDAVVHPQPAVARAEALDATVRIGQATEAETAQPIRPVKSYGLGTAVDFSSAPPGRKPDWFYREVANQYGRLVAASNRPAAEMAELHAIPVTTVHRWVKEARRRGFLGPGRKGRRG